MEEDEELDSHEVESYTCTNEYRVGIWPGGPRQFATYLPIGFTLSGVEPGDEYEIVSVLEIDGCRWELPKYSLRCDDSGILQAFDGLLHQPGAIRST